MQSVCVVELHAIVKYTQMLSDAQQYFYGKFMSLATMQIILPDVEKNYIPTHSFHKLHINTTMQQKKSVCSWPSLDA